MTQEIEKTIRRRIKEADKNGEIKRGTMLRSLLDGILESRKNTSKTLLVDTEKAFRKSDK